MKQSNGKILVTGGAGFIGSHLCERLVKDGFSVICLDNFNDFYDPRLKEDNIKNLLKNKKFRLIRGDILDKNLLEDIFSKNKISKIVHLAAIPGVRQSVDNPFIYIDVDIKGTVLLLEAAKRFKVRHFIFGSSSTVYGQDSKIPFDEKEEKLIPISPYGASKLAAEEFCRAYHKLYGIKITILRYFCAFGPRQRPELVLPKFIRLIKKGEPLSQYGSGESARDYTFIDDIVDGTFRAIKKEFDFEIFNLGNSSPVKLKDLVRLLAQKTGMPVKIKKLPEQLGDVAITYADIKKGKRMLGWQPKVSLGEGMEKYLTWYGAKEKFLDKLNL